MIESIAIWAIGAVLALAGLGATVRAVRGPSVLDRTVAVDVLVAILVCALGLEAAVTRHTTTLPILVSLSMLGFIGSVAVARFAANDHARTTEAPATDPTAAEPTAAPDPREES